MNYFTSEKKEGNEAPIQSVVFLSNYFNHHQLPICESLSTEIGDGFIFIETDKMSSERLNMGWEISNIPPYVVTSEKFAQKQEEYIKLLNLADAVIIGSASSRYIHQRIRAKKLVFRYAERQLKKGLEIWKYPYRFLKWHHDYGFGNNVYLLCASAYAAADYARFFLFRGRAYKWGYFPEVRRYNDFDTLLQKKKPNSIIWVARFIDWKHPELAIKLAKKLKKEGYNFCIKMIGIGPLQEAAKEMIRKYKLDDTVSLLGSMRPEEVRLHMETSSIHLFTSDQQEGWGAVLNESMNSGCAVVANAAIGSVPYLLKHGVNGMIYETEDEAYKYVRELLTDVTRRHELGKAAYVTLTSLWTPDLAAKRFVQMIEQLQSKGCCNLFPIGPCSPANA